RAQAQATGMPADSLPKKSYTNKTTFRLPVSIDEATRASLQEVRLYVKKAPGEWMCATAAPASQRYFEYQVSQDGEYWVSVATVSRAGQISPPDVSREPPSLIVVVDTQLPEVEVRPLPVASGEVFLQCEIRDANPDPVACRLEYRAADQTWRPLEQYPDTPGVFRVPDADVLTGRVRATACDLAKNTAMKEINLGSPATSSVIAPPPPPPPVFPKESRPEKVIADKPAVGCQCPPSVSQTLVQSTSAMPVRKVVNS